MEIKKSIDNILNYLEEEEKHFWENCTCSEEMHKYKNTSLCKCEENKNHILRDVEKVEWWLNSPSCPLTDEGEL